MAALFHRGVQKASRVEFERESEEERIVVTFNNADRPREIRIPLTGTPAQGAAEIALLLGDSKVELAGIELHPTLPAESLSILALN
jgi:hypothetical protein